MTIPAQGLQRGNFLTGTPGRFEQKSLLDQSQMPVYGQLTNAAQRSGAGGAFGQSSDYFRSLLNDQNPTLSALQAPEYRRFQEETIPGLAEQFAGMGFGGSALNSSGFRNAAVNAGASLAERLAAMRANLRQQGAQGLFQTGQQALQPYNENVYFQGQPGLLDSLGSGLGQVGGALASMYLPGGSGALLAALKALSGNKNTGSSISDQIYGR